MLIPKKLKPQKQNLSTSSRFATGRDSEKRS